MRRHYLYVHEDSGVACGNARHPDGAWHPAAPLWWERGERIAQWWRRMRWGCGCPRMGKR